MLLEGDYRDRTRASPIPIAIDIDIIARRLHLARIGPRRRGGEEVDGEGASSGRLQGDFAEGRRERREQLLGELLVRMRKRQKESGISSFSSSMAGNMKASV